ncbi:MAG: DUF2203 domain-containing protein [Pyrinomonadaceae bacterium]|nr:DUF2203 domain-containing protein [Pyrinomonadaceae bacterium]
MKLFTVDEANQLIPRMRMKLEMIQRLYETVGSMRETARAAAAASEKGGGMEGGTQYVRALYEIGKLTTEIAEAGVQLKDYERGLIDFPSMRNGRIVLLCWQLGEADEIEWFHDLDAGFAGRRPLTDID